MACSLMMATQSAGSLRSGSMQPCWVALQHFQDCYPESRPGYSEMFYVIWPADPTLPCSRVQLLKEQVLVQPWGSWGSVRFATCLSDLLRLMIVSVKLARARTCASPAAAIALRFFSFKNTDTMRPPSGLTFAFGPRGSSSSFLHRSPEIGELALPGAGPAGTHTSNSGV